MKEKEIQCVIRREWRVKSGELRVELRKKILADFQI